MKVKNIQTQSIGNSSMFHNNNLNRIIVATPFWIGEDDSEKYEVHIRGFGWISLAMAFREKVVIPDRYTNYFRESQSELEMERGYYD